MSQAPKSKKFNTDSVRVRLPIVMALAILPVLMFSLASAIKDYRDRQDSAARNLVSSAQIVTSEIERVISNAEQVLLMVRRQSAVTDNYQPACREFLRAAIAGTPAFGDLAVVARNGEMLCSAVAQAQPVNVSAEAWFRTALEEPGLTVGRLIGGKWGGEDLLVAALPVDVESAAHSALLILSIRATFLDRALRYSMRDSEFDLFLVDDDAVVLATRSPAEILPKREILRAHMAQGKDFFSVHSQSKHLYYYALVPLGRGISAVVASRAIETSLPLEIGLALDVGRPLLLTTIALLFVWVALERMALRWIRHLRAVVIAHRRGMTGVRARDYEDAPIEFRELGDAVNTMAEAVESRQARLVASLEEREGLVRELHHRVKNNLQIIVSLINMELRIVERDDERARLQEMLARVESLAIVHHAAYQAESLQRISMSELLPAFLARLEHSMAGEGRTVSISHETDDIKMTMDAAVPLSQFLVEVISERRLFSEVERDGAIRVALRKEGDEIVLRVDDDASVAPVDEQSRRRALSKSLVAAFSKQLGGVLERQDAGKTTILRMSGRSNAPAP